MGTNCGTLPKDQRYPMSVVTDESGVSDCFEDGRDVGVRSGEVRPRYLRSTWTDERHGVSFR